MHLYLTVYEIGGISVHFLKSGIQEIPPHFQSGFQYHIKRLFTMILVVGVLEQRGNVKDLIEQEFQISFANEFLRHVLPLL